MEFIKELLLILSIFFLIKGIEIASGYLYVIIKKCIIEKQVPEDRKGIKQLVKENTELRRKGQFYGLVWLLLGIIVKFFI